MKPLPARRTDTPKRSKRKAGELLTERFEVRASSKQIERWTTAASAEGYLGLADWLRDTLDGRARSRALTSSDNQTHRTPREVIECLERFGAIVLDPCSGPGSLVPARIAWTEADDGLRADRVWAVVAPAVDGCIYVNPPFNRAAAWSARCIEEAARGACVILLVPARKGAQWYRACEATASASCDVRGRLRFVGAKDDAPFPVTIFVWFGDRSHDFEWGEWCSAFGELGDCIHLERMRELGLLVAASETSRRARRDASAGLCIDCEHPECPPGADDCSSCSRCVAFDVA